MNLNRNCTPIIKNTTFSIPFQLLKCGYCGFILHGSCGNALAHHCFSNFDEDVHAIKIDENSVVTMGKCKTFSLCIVIKL